MANKVEVRPHIVAMFVHEDGRKDFSLKENQLIETFPDVTLVPGKGSFVFVKYQGKNYRAEVDEVEHHLGNDLTVLKSSYFKEL